jgi:hypothetical protein
MAQSTIVAFAVFSVVILLAQAATNDQMFASLVDNDAYGQAVAGPYNRGGFAGFREMQRMGKRSPQKPQFKWMRYGKRAAAMNEDMEE